MMFTRGLLHRVLLAAFLLVSLSFTVPAAQAQTSDQIVVEGNHRVDADTIRSYFTGSPQQGANDLRSTGLFKSVNVRSAGGRIYVSVVENTIINRVAFEGNSKLKGDQLIDQIQTKAHTAYNQATVDADIAKIQEIYKRNGRGEAKVTARTVDLPNGKLDVVFTINEGEKTGIREIHFAGNHVYSEGKLIGLMQSTEMNWLSWFKTSDVYDPDRIASDEEIIRRYYLRNGFADFRVVSTDAHYDEAKAGYIITITVDEGPRYTISSVNVDSHIAGVDGGSLLRQSEIKAGETYDGPAVEQSVESITREVGRRGYAFSQVRPRGERNAADNSIAVNFVVDDGPRVYVERINIHGNTRTRDYVIRREFDIGEGDAYNRVMVDRAERRLNNLGFFKKVKITTLPGSSPDKVIIDVEVEDQPTGSFAVSGGYSTTDGAIGEVSLTESNFLGRGQFVRIAASLGQYSRGVDFSFTEPYFMDRRLAAGFDLFYKLTDNTQYSLYETWVEGGTVRLGIPLTDEFSVTPHYSLYETRIKIPNSTSQPYNDCTFPIAGYTNGSCLDNGEASLAIKEAQGGWLTSMAGYTLTYSTLDNNKNPTKGLRVDFTQDVAGLGGDAKWVRETGDIHYYHPLLPGTFDDVVGFARLQGGNIKAFGGNQLRVVDNFNLGPSLVRGFAPNGIGPRDISDPNNIDTNSLGGTTYYGGTLEVQFPLGLPKELGMKFALFADAGTLIDYEGKTNFNQFLGLRASAPCQSIDTIPGQESQGSCIKVWDDHKIRSSVGTSLIWASPLGPIRFDFAVPVTKGKYDQTQFFRFSGGTSF
ncbi:outer membrane protein assembly factor BamA [Methylovirgula sp. 4M-Z18]|uniref:outer membrane protein assembly factor BamA n=1 Tax=Methylovirgula sp. 4M-Z18 TaxID=2293567 RepID=UPI000E2FBD47|nr:outer membrane protein assembly factor BamA [Methylovirgula sp. 4M-Z18]RFB80219.1 outer membrane protein assembly factor BamA [Methylovirgula sp. 4M-Z18]